MHKLRKSTDPNNSTGRSSGSCPQDIIDNTVKAFSVSATGYTQGAPTGRYFAPANGPDCLETSLIGPTRTPRRATARAAWAASSSPGRRSFRVDITIGKRFKTVGPVNAEFQIMIFNLFNNVNFNPVGGTLAPSYVGSVKDSFASRPRRPIHPGRCSSRSASPSDRAASPLRWQRPLTRTPRPDPFGRGVLRTGLSPLR